MRDLKHRLCLKIFHILKVAAGSNTSKLRSLPYAGGKTRLPHASQRITVSAIQNRYLPSLTVAAGRNPSMRPSSKCWHNCSTFRSRGHRTVQTFNHVPDSDMCCKSTEYPLEVESNGTSLGSSAASCSRRRSGAGPSSRADAETMAARAAAYYARDESPDTATARLSRAWSKLPLDT